MKYLKWTQGALQAMLLLLCVACNEGKEQDLYIPQVPDYENDTFWFTNMDDSTDNGADVFYLVSTWQKDWTTDDGRLCRYADVYNTRHRANMDKEISKIAEYMGEGNNFYAPYYRHMTIENWATLNEDTINNRFHAVAMKDVQQAFNIFLSHRKPERPFVLAGFSQGGKAVVELLKSMPDSLHRYLVAAYVLGYKVTPDDQLATTNILHQARSGSPLRHVHQSGELANRCHSRHTPRHNHRYIVSRTSRIGAERIQRRRVFAHHGIS